MSDSYGTLKHSFDRDGKHFELFHNKETSNYTVVVDKGKQVIGPMSAGEFISAWFKHMLKEKK